MDLNEITYTINGAVFEVNKILGSGFLEKVNENALLVELRKRGLNAQAQVPISARSSSARGKFRHTPAKPLMCSGQFVVVFSFIRSDIQRLFEIPWFLTIWFNIFSVSASM